MLEKLTIKDFQAHRKLSIDLDPAITAIVGPSDAGKSAVIRALIWLSQNKPLGDAFIRDGTKKTLVTLLVDGHEVIRTRGKSLNTYSLDGEELKAFGNNVPEEVAQLLNLSPINLQHQHDAPFWFSKTAGEVSRQLNQIVDLSIIDRTLANLDKASRMNSAEIQTLEEQEERAKEDRSALSWVRKAQKDIGEVETLQERWISAGRSHLNAVERVQSVRLHRDRARQLGSHKLAAEGVLQIGMKHAESFARVVKVRRLIRDVKVSTEEIKIANAAEGVARVGSQWKGKLDRLTLLRRLTREVRKRLTEVRQPVPDVVDLVQLSEVAVKAAKKSKALRVLIGSVRTSQEEVRELIEDSEKAEEEFHELMGDVCPLCGEEKKS